MNKFRKLKAFTLAETLITIAIVGVVSAMTIPNLMHKYYEKQTVAKLKETYSIMSQAVRMAEQEYGDVSGWGLKRDSSASDAQIIANNLKPYIKLSLDCGTSDTKNACITSSRYKLLSGAGASNYADNNYYKINLINGSSVWWRGADSNISSDKNSYFVLFVDTNGKAFPNVWGRDLFAFIYDFNKGLIPCGTLGSSHENTCKDKNSVGYGCAYYVLQNENMDYLKK